MREIRPAPISEPRNSQTPVASATAPKPRKLGFGIDVITSGAPRKHFTHSGVASRGVGTRCPDRPEPGDPRYARRDRHDLSHRSRPPVGAPCGALYSGSDTGAPRQRSATARQRRPLIPGVRPARRRDVVRFHGMTERLSTPRTATPSWGKNTSRAEFRRRRYYVHPERRFLTFGCRRASDGGAPFWSRGSLLSGSRRARHCRRSETSVLSRSTRLSGASGGDRP